MPAMPFYAENDFMKPMSLIHPDSLHLNTVDIFRELPEVPGFKKSSNSSFATIRKVFHGRSVFESVHRVQNRSPNFERLRHQ